MPNETTNETSIEISRDKNVVTLKVKGIPGFTSFWSSSFTLTAPDEGWADLLAGQAKKVLDDHCGNERLARYVACLRGRESIISDMQVRLAGMREKLKKLKKLKK